MEVPTFFERDPDEILFRGVTYLNYFNLYPNLSYAPTLKHLQDLTDVLVQTSANDSAGWQIAVKFCETDFLLDTHYHGTSTLFCSAKGVTDVTCMLAFLGCFSSTLRDHWRLSNPTDKKKTNWLRNWFR
jgi:hypothetical protein